MAVIFLVNAGKKNTVFFIAAYLAGMAGLHYAQVRPLSANISTERAEYTARIITATMKNSEQCVAVADLIERLSPFAAPVSGWIQLRINGRCEINSGSIIRFHSAIKPVMHFKNPGVFDAREHQRRKNIWGRAHIESPAALVILSRPDTSFFDARRDAIRKLISKGGYFEPAILESFLLGNDSMHDAERMQIKDAGLMHLFAISGMNFSVMAVFAYLLVSFMTRPLTQLLRHVPRQKIAAVFTQLFVIYYALLVEPTPSVIRAAIMIGVYLTAIMLERQRELVRVILVAACLELFFSPLDFFSISFQLTYLCVLILALLSPKFEKLLEKLKLFPQRPALVHYLARLVAASLLLSFLLMPFVLMEFGSAPLNGIINNIWAIPLFDFILVPLALGFVSLHALGISSMADILLYLIDCVLHIFMQIVQTINSLGIIDVGGLSPHTTHVVIFYAGLLILSLHFRKSLLATWVLLLVLSVAATAYQNWHAYDLRITQIDVGQGDSILIQTRNNNLLIDTGGHRFIDTGTQVLIPVLRHLWVRKLDAVIITHPDLDHDGGLPGLITHFPVGEIITGTRRDQKLSEAIAYAGGHGIPIREVRSPQKWTWPDATELHLMTPLASPEEMEKWDDNDTSLVLKITHGEFSALFTGDLPDTKEAMLIDTFGKQLKSDLLKVGHHGSKSSTSEFFLKTVAPRFAFIGVGENNRYRHPAKPVLSRLKSSGACILRTDEDGAIMMIFAAEKGENQPRVTSHVHGEKCE